MRSTQIKYSRHVKWINTQVFNITFLYNCADSKLEIPDKSIPVIQINRIFEYLFPYGGQKIMKNNSSFQNMLCESWIYYPADLNCFPAVVFFLSNPSIN